MFGFNKRNVVEVHFGSEGAIIVNAPPGLDVRFFDQRRNGGSIPDCDNHSPDFYVGQEVIPRMDEMRGQRWWVKEVNSRIVIVENSSGELRGCLKSELIQTNRNKFYPTAEQTREIESEIDWDKVNNALNDALVAVLESAKLGKSSTLLKRYVFFGVIGEEKGQWGRHRLSRPEIIELKYRLRNLGYCVVEGEYRSGHAIRIEW